MALFSTEPVNLIVDDGDTAIAEDDAYHNGVTLSDAADNEIDATGVTDTLHGHIVTDIERVEIDARLSVVRTVNVNR